MLFFEVRIRLEECSALPSVQRRKRGVPAFQCRRDRGAASVASGAAMLMRHMESEFVLIILYRLCRAVFGIGVGAETARVEAPGVEFRFAMHNQLREHPTVASALAEPGAKPYDAKRVRPSRNPSDQRQPVCGVCDRSVHDRTDSCIGKCGKPRNRAFHHIRNPIQIVVAKLLGKGRIYSVHPPQPAMLLIKSDKQARFLLSAIEIVRRTSEQGESPPGLNDIGYRPCHQILMLHRNDRKGGSHHRCDFVDTVSGGDDDDLAVNRTGIGFDEPFSASSPADVLDFGLLQNGCARASGAPCQRMAKLRRINVSVQRVPKPADKTVF